MSRFRTAALLVFCAALLLIAPSWTPVHHAIAEKVFQRTKPAPKYLVRDYSLHLGYNNVRNIIATALNQAHLLRRTLILPSYLYFRTCVFPDLVCSTYATTATLEKKPRYKVPLADIFDLDRLSTHIAFTTTEDFAAVLGEEVSELSWNNRVVDRSNLTVKEIGVYEYDMARTYFIKTPAEKFQLRPIDSLVLDRKYFQKPKSADEMQNNLCKHVRGLYQEGQTRTFDLGTVSRQYYLSEDAVHIERLQACLADHRLVLLFSYDTPIILQLLTSPKTMIASLDKARGFTDDWLHDDASVLHLSGELQMGPAAAMFFTTPQARDLFFTISTEWLRPHPSIGSTAARLAARLRDLNQRSTFIAAHLRRTDQASSSWVPKNVDEHIQKLARALESARQSSKAGDKFFLSTDETDPAVRKRLQDIGGVFIEDLLTTEDYRRLGWMGMFSDYLAILSQSVAVRAVFFIGSETSSLSGTIINLRKASGHSVDSYSLI